MRNTILSNKTLGIALCAGALALASATSAQAQHLGGGLVGGMAGRIGQIPTAAGQIGGAAQAMGNLNMPPVDSSPITTRAQDLRQRATSTVKQAKQTATQAAGQANGQASANGSVSASGSLDGAALSDAAGNAANTAAGRALGRLDGQTACRGHRRPRTEHGRRSRCGRREQRQERRRQGPAAGCQGHVHGTFAALAGCWRYEGCGFVRR